MQITLNVEAHLEKNLRSVHYQLHLIIIVQAFPIGILMKDSHPSKERLEHLFTWIPPHPQLLLSFHDEPYQP